MRARDRLGICVALAAFVVLAYAEAPSFPFLEYDDPLYVTQNEMARDGFSWDGIVWATTRHSHGNARKSKPPAFYVVAGAR